MIDITVDNDLIEVEMTNYHKLTKEQLSVCLKDIIDKVKYSGESITLWIAIDNTTKRLVGEW